MFQDAMDTGLIDVNPFSRLNIAGSSGRRDHAPLTVEELHRLADLSLDVHGPDYGPVMRAMILFTGYVGPRIEEAIRGRSAHYWSWNFVRAAFRATLPEHRCRAIVDLDWHSLRHFCGWHFYVNLGFSDELTAYQLGHADAKLVRDLYGHGRADALERLKHGARVEVQTRPRRRPPYQLAFASRKGASIRGVLVAADGNGLRSG